MPSSLSPDPHRARTPRLAARWLATAGLTLLSVGACRSATPPTPGPNRIIFADPAGRLAAVRPLADSVAARTMERVVAPLQLTDVTITVTPDASRAIGGYGLGGYTPSGREVQLYLDPDFPDLAALIPERLSLLVAHELHHARRWRGPGYGSTLLEAMVSEGMADHFAHELLALPLPPWSEAFAADSTELLLTRARPEFDSSSYDHARWFFDADPSIPRWTAYTLGYRLVTAYLATHPGASATTLVTTPAQAFRP